MPTVYMMIGLPCAGKSTMIQESAELKGLPSVSSDSYIENYAKSVGKTYDDVFGEVIKDATAFVNDMIDFHIRNSQSFILDQTNLSAKTRAKRLARFPRNWKKIAVFLAIPEKEEWHRRLASRPGKTIPRKILESMLTQLEPPNLVDEDFDRILSNVNMDEYQV